MSSQQEESQDLNVPNGRSWAWKYFMIQNVVVDDQTANWAVCRHCTKSKHKLNENGKGSTGNMITHLRNKHGELIRGDDPKFKDNQDLLPSSSTTSVGFSADIYREALLKWIVHSNQPFSEIENRHFLDVVKSLNPAAETPSATTIKRDFMAKFSTELTKMSKFISEIPGKISFTHDAWTSKNCLPFFGIRAHWISSEWKLLSVLIDFAHLEGSHDGPKLAKCFLSSLSKFGISNSKIMGITKDNATSNDTFMDFLLDIEEEEEDQELITLSSGKNRVRCLAHIINLAAQDFLSSLKILPRNTEDQNNLSEEEIAEEGAEVNERSNDVQLVNEDELEQLEAEVEQESEDDASPNDVSNLIQKLRKLVKMIRKSPQLRQKLRDFCIESKLKILYPIIDCKTRWNATYDMIKRAETLKLPLLLLCSSVKKLNRYIITETDWNLVENLKVILEKFDKATKIFSLEGTPVITKYILTINWLMNSLAEVQDTIPCLESAASLAYEKLEKYVPSFKPTSGNYYEIPFICCILHPGLKLKYFNDCDMSKEEVSEIKNIFMAVFKEYNTPAVVEPEEDSNDDLDDLDNFAIKRRKKDRVSSEVTQYLSAPRASISVNVLDWWKNHESDYKCLSRMARDYLGAQGASVSNERDFSAGSHVISPTRCSLDGKTISAIMCLKSWWRD